MTRKKPGRKKSASAHVALLRGINVGGKNRLPMKTLVALFTAVGCDDVKTYIQSGNVVFGATAALARRVPGEISGAISDRLELDVPVVTRSLVELREIVESNPYIAAGADPTKLHVAFLADRPDSARVATLDPDRSPPDEFTARGAEIYFHFPGGVARTKFTNAYLDATLETTSTLRNWRTTLKLRELAEG